MPVLEPGGAWDVTCPPRVTADPGEPGPAPPLPCLCCLWTFLPHSPSGHALILNPSLSQHLKFYNLSTTCNLGTMKMF